MFSKILYVKLVLLYSIDSFYVLSLIEIDESWSDLIYIPRP